MGDINIKSIGERLASHQINISSQKSFTVIINFNIISAQCFDRVCELGII